MGVKARGLGWLVGQGSVGSESWDRGRARLGLGRRLVSAGYRARLVSRRDATLGEVGLVRRVLNKARASAGKSVCVARLDHVPTGNALTSVEWGSRRGAFLLRLDKRRVVGVRCAQ